MFLKIRYAFLFLLFLLLIYLCFFYVHPVEILGNSIRILFFHVPSAWTSVISFMMSLYFSLIYLKLRDPDSARKAYVVSLAGLLLLAAAAISGSLWAKSAWNSYWNWDVRQTSIVLLFLIYSAYFSIRMSVKNIQSRDMISSVYLIFSSFTVPFFIFIIPRFYESLHPDLITGEIKEVSFGSRVIPVLIFSLLLFTWLYFEIIISLIRKKKNDL